MKLELIGESWDKVRYKTRIFLQEDTELTTFEDDKSKFIKDGKSIRVPYKKIIIKKGNYYIVGFWANMMGLTQNRENLTIGKTDLYIQGNELKLFYRRMN